MTIFSEIVEEFFNSALCEISDNSVRADNSFFGGLRDNHLSKRKREAVLSISIAWTKVSEKTTDEQVFQQINNLYEQALNNIEQSKKQAKVSNQGTTERQLEYHCLLLKSFYQELSELSLLDVPSRNTLAQLAIYHLASYLLQHLDEARKEYVLKYAISNSELASLKKEAVKETIGYLNNPELSNENVLDILNALEDKNKNLCNKNSNGFLGSGLGKLHMAIHAAKEEVYRLALSPSLTMSQS
ncbi:MAG: hypothetical protein CMF38_07120 [Legionellaceae bacterium]|nr:hypothetical protein [Legionellaceae bacterium]|tara:strand:- start:2938 stop:3666 length:729 start_codon:yes stop_codon:yes gene_type:complete